MALPGGPIDQARLARLVAAIPPERFAAQRWFGAKGRPIARLGLDDAAPLPGGTGEQDGLLAVVGVGYVDGGAERYLLPLVHGDPPPRGEGPVPPALELRDEHGAIVLREAREGDGVGRRLVRAIAGGATLPALRGAFVGEPAAAIGTLLPPSLLADAALAERGLPVDQTNASVIVGERVVCKSYRRLEPGINPDVEISRFLVERAGFPHTPTYAGTVRYVGPDGVSASAGMLQAFVPGGRDGWAATVEELRAWLGAPPEDISLTAATEEAARLGAITAQLHAALASARDEGDFAPRRADAAMLRDWRAAAERQLDDGLALLDGEARRAVAALAPRIRPRFAAFETPAAAPILIRVHGDYHLGQILRAGERRLVVDFEGEPTRTLEERRRRQSPLRDVAAMLRSFDHVARQAVRESGGGPGLDVEAWLRESRRRFLAAYRAGLRRSGAPIVVDAGLLRAFELEKECYELTYEATYLPDWLWMPLTSLRALVASPTASPAPRCGPRR